MLWKGGFQPPSLPYVARIQPLPRTGIELADHENLNTLPYYKQKIFVAEMVKEDAEPHIRGGRFEKRPYWLSTYYDPLNN